MRSARFIGRVVGAAAVLIGAQLASAAVIKLDFGRHDGTNGAATASPDANGNYWNNLSPATASSSSLVAVNSTFGPFVTTTNTPTTVGIKVTSGTGTSLGYWECNGILNGGLTTPSSSLLGDFAVATATEDYWFVAQGTANQSAVTLDITGLDPTKSYNFRMFGTRNTDANTTRTTRYTLTGANTGTDVLQTSGPSAGSAGHPYGNDDTISSINGIQPTASGIVTTKLEVVNGSFAYLAAMEITEAPEPATLTAAIGLVSVLARRRRA